MAAKMGDSESILAGALKDMDKKWAGTASAWQDQARADFEKEYLEPLRVSIGEAQRAMRGLNQLMQKVVRECS